MNRFAYMIAGMALLVMIALGVAYFVLAGGDSEPQRTRVHNTTADLDTTDVASKPLQSSPAAPVDEVPVADDPPPQPEQPVDQPAPPVDQPPVEEPPVTYKEEEFVVSGTVLRDNGEPVVAQIQLLARSGGHVNATIIATSDTNGAFVGAAKLKFPSNGAGVEVSLKAIAGGVSSEAQTVTAYPFTTIGVEFRLPVGSSVAGTLLDPAGNPVIGAEIMIRIEKERAGPRCLSDAEGAFACADLGAGDYVVVIRAKGYKSPHPPQRVTVNSGDVINLEPIVLEMLTAIRFRLLSPDGVLPAKGTAEVHDLDGQVTRLELAADRDGYVLLGPVPDNAIEFELKVQFGEQRYSTTGRVSVSVVPGSHVDIGDVTVEQQP